MTKNFNTPNNPKISMLLIIIVSFIPGTVATFLTYLYFEWYIGYAKIGTHELNKIYAFIIGVLAYIIAISVGYIFGRAMYSAKGTKSVISFKKFTDAIYAAPDEEVIFTTLHQFLQNSYRNTKISIYYKATLSSDSSEWKSYPPGLLPICNMSQKTCPVIVQKNECFVNDVKSDLTCAFQLPFVQVGSYVCLLMSIDKNPHAVVQLYSKSKDYFHADVIADIKNYINSIPPILRDKNELKDLNTEAFTDRLTQVRNRTYLEQHLEGILEYANRNNESLSLMMIDLDHFKKINDTYGHLAGDCILVEFTSLVKKCVRNQDIIARYGGEEFIVILPQSNIAYATEVGERIRRTVALEEMPLFQGSQLPNITCSIGVSSYPEYCSDKENLIKTADMALYHAKRTGRNKVIAYDPYNIQMNANLKK